MQNTLQPGDKVTQPTHTITNITSRHPQDDATQIMSFPLNNTPEGRDTLTRLILEFPRDFCGDFVAIEGNKPWAACRVIPNNDTRRDIFPLDHEYKTGDMSHPHERGVRLAAEGSDSDSDIRNIETLIRRTKRMHSYYGTGHPFGVAPQHQQDSRLRVTEPYQHVVDAINRRGKVTVDIETVQHYTHENFLLNNNIKHLYRDINAQCYDEAAEQTGHIARQIEDPERLRNAGIARPMGWNEMGSSARDLWQDRQIEALDRPQASQRPQLTTRYPASGSTTTGPRY